MELGIEKKMKQIWDQEKKTVLSSRKAEQGRELHSLKADIKPCFQFYQLVQSRIHCTRNC